MTFVAIYLAALLAKAMRVPYVKEIKWSYFFVIPLILIPLRIAWTAFKYLFAWVGAILGLDFLLWAYFNAKGSEYQMLTFLFIKRVFEAIKSNL